MREKATSRDSIKLSLHTYRVDKNDTTQNVIVFCILVYNNITLTYYILYIVERWTFTIHITVVMSARISWIFALCLEMC